MPTYDYEIIETGEIIEVTHSIKDDALTQLFSPELQKEMPCRRLISMNYGGINFKGNGWTVKQSGFGKRGYKGKFQHLVRDKGTPVDAPALKHEADRQFQQWVDSGGMDGIKPTFKFDDKAKPMTTEQRIEKRKC